MNVDVTLFWETEMYVKLWLKLRLLPGSMVLYHMEARSFCCYFRHPKNFKASKRLCYFRESHLGGCLLSGFEEVTTVFPVHCEKR